MIDVEKLSRKYDNYDYEESKEAFKSLNELEELGVLKVTEENNEIKIQIIDMPLYEKMIKQTKERL